jgi:hypothetical protein
MPTYSSPKYNNRVGVYRTNEIERFERATPIIYDIYAGEYFAFKFTSIDKITSHSATYQTAAVYYNTFNGSLGLNYYQIHISQPGFNYPALSSGYYLQPTGSPAWQSPGDYLGSAKVISLYSGTPFAGNWTFTVGSIGDNENDQTNLKVTNSYWFVGVFMYSDFNLRTTFPTNFLAGSGGVFQTTCMVYRSGVWVTASTSAYFGFTNIGS